MTREETTILFVQFPKCSTCKKAKAWLDGQGISYTDRPTIEELKAWHAMSGLPLRRFFNTSGMLYREMGLKDRLGDMTEEEQYELLASVGMLVKRPILVGEDWVLAGSKEQ